MLEFYPKVTKNGVIAHLVAESHTSSCDEAMMVLAQNADLANGTVMAPVRNISVLSCRHIC